MSRNNQEKQIRNNQIKRTQSDYMKLVDSSEAMKRIEQIKSNSCVRYCSNLNKLIICLHTNLRRRYLFLTPEIKQNICELGGKVLKVATSNDIDFIKRESQTLLNEYKDNLVKYGGMIPCQNNQN